MLKRTLPITLLVLLACAPAAAASPRAHSAAEQEAEAALREAERMVDGRGVRTGRELTAALRELATALRHLRGDDEERAVALLSRPTDADAPADERYTVPELPPLCDANFCVHSVGTGEDAPPTGFAALTLAEANAVRTFTNGALGWREPPSDGDGRVDIFLKELGSHRLFGFAATDPGQEQQEQHSYLVLDNDFHPAQYGGVAALESLRVTLAHEYTHVLQYGYDILADNWHFESSAVWMEQRMYPEIEDWLRFIEDRPSGAGWASLPELPLTYFEPDPDADGALDPRTVKPYGDVVWNQYLSARHADGDALQRRMWEISRGLDDPSTTAHDTAIRAFGGAGLEPVFAEFAAAVAEWRVPASPFPVPAELPDVERRGALVRDGAAVSALMDHLSFGLYDVPPTTGPLRLSASFPLGLSAAIALVARAGDAETGEAIVRLVQLPEGGLGGVTLENPQAFHATGGRVTAVLVNSDASHGPWADGDWTWLRDDQAVRARASSDVLAPRASIRGLRLRSRDADRLTYDATLRQAGRVVGRRSGSVRPRGSRSLGIAGGAPGRARLVVKLADPHANERRLVSTVRLGA